ncbi:MAG: hypothetical protein R2722_01355 [Tessaracoccus sp.]
MPTTGTKTSARARRLRGKPASGSSPEWLRERLINETDWASYPTRPCSPPIAAYHGVSEDMVLSLAGAAEGFTLIA